MNRFSAWVLSLGFALPMAHAQSDFFKALDVSETQHDVETSPWSKHAELLLISKYGVDKPPVELGAARNKTGWSQVKTQLFTELQYQSSSNSSWKISAAAESEWLQWNQNDQSWHGHNQILRLHDAYFDCGFKHNAWLKVGQQLFAWGESEGLAITDVLSPSDQREPGQAELKNLRETIPALSAIFAVNDNLKINTVFTYNAGTHRYADAGDPFDFFAAQRAHGFSPHISTPLKDWEYAIRMQWQLNGSDIHLVSARVNDNTLSVNAINPNTGLIELAQKRITVHGISANRVSGHWLWKGEMALWQNVRSSLDKGINWLNQDQYRAMIGLEYSGIADLALAAEINSIYSSPPATSNNQEKMDIGYVVRAQKDSFNNRVNNQLWIIQFANFDGQILRWDSTYDWDDHLRLGLTLVSYNVNNSQSVIYPFRYHDSINGSVTYQF